MLLWVSTYFLLCLSPSGKVFIQSTLWVAFELQGYIPWIGMLLNKRSYKQQSLLEMCQLQKLSATKPCPWQQLQSPGRWPASLRPTFRPKIPQSHHQRAESDLTIMGSHWQVTMLSSCSNSEKKRESPGRQRKTNWHAQKRANRRPHRSRLHNMINNMSQKTLAKDVKGSTIGMTKIFSNVGLDVMKLTVGDGTITGVQASRKCLIRLNIGSVLTVWNKRPFCCCRM